MTVSRCNPGGADPKPLALQEADRENDSPERCVSPVTVRMDFTDPAERSRHLADPGRFANPYRRMPAGGEGPFVLVDEAQTVPSMFGAVQHVYDVVTQILKPLQLLQELHRRRTVR